METGGGTAQPSCAAKVKAYRRHALSCQLPLRIFKCNRCDDAAALATNTAVCTLYLPCKSASRTEVGAHALALNTLQVGAKRGRTSSLNYKELISLSGTITTHGPGHGLKLPAAGACAVPLKNPWAWVLLEYAILVV